MIGVDDNEDRCSNEMVYITDIIIFGIQCYPFAPSVHHTFFLIRPLEIFAVSHLRTIARSFT